jgi:cbb3-type cytochrome oxidase maturation protein
MEVLVWLIPFSLIMGAIGLTAFFWALKSGQFDDTEGDAHRMLMSDFDKKPKN